MSLHCFLRASGMPSALSKSMKSFKIRTFFNEKWQLFHGLAGSIDIKIYASIHFMSICLLAHFMKNFTEIPQSRFFCIDI